MIKVHWDLEEAVALFDIYLKNGGHLSIPEDILVKLRNMYIKRAHDNGIIIDEKFRNLSGLKMQLGCIHYVVTDGKEGMSNASKLFYDTYELYKNDAEKFSQILKEFYIKYAV